MHLHLFGFVDYAVNITLIINDAGWLKNKLLPLGIIIIGKKTSVIMF